MSALKKYKSFDEAAQAIIDESFQKKPVRHIKEGWPEEFSHAIGIPYKPGVYRFHSFEQASEYDLNQYIQQAVNKQNVC